MAKTPQSRPPGTRSSAGRSTPKQSTTTRSAAKRTQERSAPISANLSLPATRHGAAEKVPGRDRAKTARDVDAGLQKNRAAKTDDPSRVRVAGAQGRTRDLPLPTETGRGRGTAAQAARPRRAEGSIPPETGIRRAPRGAEAGQTRGRGAPPESPRRETAAKAAAKTTKKTAKKTAAKAAAPAKKAAPKKAAPQKGAARSTAAKSTAAPERRHAVTSGSSAAKPGRALRERAAEKLKVAKPTANQRKVSADDEALQASRRESVRKRLSRVPALEDGHKPSREKARGKMVPRSEDPRVVAAQRERGKEARRTESEHAGKVRRNYEIPLSMGAASMEDGGPVVPVGVGLDARPPRLYEPREPEPPRRESDPSQPEAPWLKSDPPELAVNPRDTMQAREMADDPQRGSDPPGHQQDQ